MSKLYDMNQHRYACKQNFREDCANDHIIKQLRDKKISIIESALPVQIVFVG